MNHVGDVVNDVGVVVDDHVDVVNDVGLFE